MTRAPRRSHEDVATLYDALAWLSRAWATLPVPPQRLHQSRTTEGRHTKQGSPELGPAMAPEPVGTERLGAPPYSPAFARVLFGRATDVETYEETVPCDHAEQDPVKRAEGELCPRCRIYNGLGEPFAESGTIRVLRERYRSPMAAALSRLSKMPKPSDGTPAPVEFILALAVAAWDVELAAGLLGLSPVSADHAQTIDAMFLLAIRRLHTTYSAGPIAKVGYVDLSESQRNAVDAA